MLFDGSTQRLAIVECVDAVDRLVYKGVPIHGDDEASTLRRIQQIFGPTIAPVVHPTYLEEKLTTYPTGVAFSSTGSKLRRTIVTPASNRALGAEIFSAALKSPKLLQDGFVDSVVVKMRSLGEPSTVILSIAASSDEPSREVAFALGETMTEDITCELGSPDQTYHKQDDRLQALLGNQSFGCYFLVYFKHGCDLMLDAQHRLSKVVLHSNLPGADLFGRYARCPWVVETRTGATIKWSDGIDVAAAALGGKTKPGSSARSSPASNREQPLVLDRSADSPDPLVVGKTSQLHGFPGIVLEATDNGDLETAWIV